MAREHGTHARYAIERCRCDPCRQAQREYNRHRVRQLARVAHGTLSKLIYGDRPRGMAPSKRIRPATAERILAVMPHHAAGAQNIPAAYTWRLLDDLIARGWSKAELARRLGHQGPGLQIGRRHVRASTARKVEQLHAQLTKFPVIPARTRWGVVLKPPVRKAS